MRHNNYAVTEIVSFILVISIVSGATTAVLLWAGPAMEQAKTSINLDSTFLQLKALSDLVDRVTNQGVNSSQEMSVETENGNFYFDNLSERVVIYYSICDYDPTAAPPRNVPFDFTVTGFEIGDPALRIFTIDITKTPSPPGGRLKFELYKGNDFERLVDSADGYRNEIIRQDVLFGRTITDETNTKACIRILEDTGGLPGDPKEYGEIWVFDLGSLNYQVTGQTAKAVVENGGTTKVTAGGYLSDEPRYWERTLLNGSNMTTLRIIDISSNEISTGGTGKLKTNFQVTNKEVRVLEARTKVFGDIKMKIYGDGFVVSAWYNFYKYKMGFEDSGDGGIFLDVFDGSGLTKPNYMFSLVYADCNIDIRS